MPKYKYGNLYEHKCEFCGYVWKSPLKHPKRCPLCHRLMPYWKKYLEKQKKGEK